VKKQNKEREDEGMKRMFHNIRAQHKLLDWTILLLLLLFFFNSPFQTENKTYDSEPTPLTIPSFDSRSRVPDQFINQGIDQREREREGRHRKRK
jgi:hypothetical protein